ncbi:MAG: hypothetical protein IKP48_00375 [Bacteroidaceae bacterium]|nr:hypothetical protein [Bacteroidaceae bacterium]
MQEGIQQGLQEGKQEEKLLIAANLKKMGFSLDTIQQATGLTKEEIEAL